MGQLYAEYTSPMQLLQTNAQRSAL